MDDGRRLPGRRWLALLGAARHGPWLPDWRSVALAASLPLAGAVVVNHLAPSPRKLKQVGWTVAAANAVALTVLAVGEPVAGTPRSSSAIRV